MKVTATLEFDEETLEDLWRVYDLFDHDEVVIGRLYLRSNHLPPEHIEFYREETEEDNEQQGNRGNKN